MRSQPREGQEDEEAPRTGTQQVGEIGPEGSTGMESEDKTDEKSPEEKGDEERKAEQEQAENLPPLPRDDQGIEINGPREIEIEPQGREHEKRQQKEN